ncbi:hypothetical protein [Psychroserpens algicola]|uniref:hypothetical protein n=1 Tax=Psychroserpens algicola TaxID=1719034 RepID=UPI001953CEA3|nr:hypothetical protein [Psychroserpens algicola]
MELINALEKLIEQHLKDYLFTLHHYSIYSMDNIITVSGKRKEDDISEFNLLRLGISEEHREFLIPNIFIPKDDRKKGIGLGLIAFIYEIAQKLNFGLALVQMTDSFRQKMLKRGALETGIYDCLEIVQSTNLK